MDVKIRRNWGSLSPVTKVKQSEKKYNRKKEKYNIKKEVHHECAYR